MAELAKTRMLLVDDEEGIRHGLTRLFVREGFEVETAEDCQGALRAAEAKTFHIAIVDVRLKNGERGQDVLAELRKRDPDVPVIMITAYGSVQSAVEAMKEGANDYLLKPIDNANLVQVVGRTLEVARLKKDNGYLKSELLNIVDHTIVTRDPVFLSRIDLADRVKDTQASVLLTGESGTGKEVVARYIHYTGSRRDGPFVGLNCAALSETLLLSELFGHEKGAFTGATERKIGKFEFAHKGTLFLDEIGDMSLDVQSKLLRVVEESSFERVGGTKKISVDIRLITATNKNLQELMAKGLFREDLYYRINIVNLDLPPLRERVDDVPLLVAHFVAKYARKYNKDVTQVAPRLMDKWMRHRWPGNVRELQNAVNQAVLLSTQSVLDAPAAREPDHPPMPPAALSGPRTLKNLKVALVGYYEKELVLEALEKNGYNQTRTASALEVTRKTLLRKMSEYGIPSRART